MFRTLRFCTESSNENLKPVVTTLTITSPNNVRFSQSRRSLTNKPQNKNSNQTPHPLLWPEAPAARDKTQALGYSRFWGSTCSMWGALFLFLSRWVVRYRVWPTIPFRLIYRLKWLLFRVRLIFQPGSNCRTFRLLRTTSKPRPSYSRRSLFYQLPEKQLGSRIEKMISSEDGKKSTWSHSL